MLSAILPALSSRLPSSRRLVLQQQEGSAPWHLPSHPDDLLVVHQTGVQGDIKVEDSLYCGTLTNPEGDVVLSGDMCNDGHVITDVVQADRCKVDMADIDAIVTGPNQLSVGDKLSISGTLSGPTNTSCDEVEVGGVRQSATVFLQTFDEPTEAEGWRGGSAAECGADGVLAGGCDGAEASKLITDLPPHTTLQLEASFLFVDSWEGEHAYAKVDGEHVWLDHHDARSIRGGVDMCGGAAPETRVRVPVRASVPHTAAAANITFGSTLRPSTSRGTDGVCGPASWAVDNVELRTR